jgi:hypothetical protein
MPGWYVHMEAAHDTARAMRDGDIPARLPHQPAEAKDIGEHCHTWRNYLALGSLGPGPVLPAARLQEHDRPGDPPGRPVGLDVWEVVDGEFVSKWEKWIDPISTNNSQLASQLTGGLSTQLAQVLDELTSAILSAFKGLARRDGRLVRRADVRRAAGFGDDAFYWSDMFHYRKTYQFPFVLFQQAQAALAAAAPTTSARTLRPGSPSRSAGCRTAPPTSPGTRSPTPSPVAPTATTGSVTTSSRTTWTPRTTSPATPAPCMPSTAPPRCTSGWRSATATTPPTTDGTTPRPTTTGPASRHTTTGTGPLRRRTGIPSSIWTPAPARPPHQRPARRDAATSMARTGRTSSCRTRRSRRPTR